MCYLFFPFLHNTKYIAYLKREGKREAGILKTMKKIVLFLVFCWLFCEAQVAENDGKVDSCSGMFSCCGSLSVLESLGTMGEKLTNMAGKIAVLEDNLQNTEKTVLELRSIIGGESKFSICRICIDIYIYIYKKQKHFWWPLGTPQVAFSATLRDSGAGDTGPFTTATPLQYKKVFSNVGNCYNPATGWVCFREKWIDGENQVRTKDNKQFLFRQALLQQWSKECTSFGSRCSTT